MSADLRHTIVSFQPASPLRPLLIATVSRDEDGWWSAWHEPVCYVALVETTGYDGDEVERELVPVAYDVNSLTGLGTLHDMKWSGPDLGSIDVVPADATWNEVIGLIISALSSWTFRQRRAEQRAQAVAR